MGLFTRSDSIFAERGTFYASETIFSYLKNAGSRNLNVDGSVAVKDFDYVVSAGKSAWLERLNLTVLNDGMAPSNFYGVPSLANGMLAQVVDSDGVTVLKDFTEGSGLVCMMCWSALAGADAGGAIQTVGVGDDGSNVRWTMAKCGEPIFLRAGQIFRLKVRDNLSSMTRFLAMVQGILVDEV